MSKTEKTSIEFSDLNVILSLDTDNFPEELKTPLSQTYDPESTYAMSGVAVGEALKPVYDKISTVLGGVDQTYSPRSASAQSGIAVRQAIDDVENRIKEFDNALEGCNDAVIMAREAANRAAASSISAQKSASTAVFAKSDLETARDTAVSAATTDTDAASSALSVKSYLETARDTAVSAANTANNAAAAAATSETNATTAAASATSAQTAAEAAQVQADTYARACAIYDQRVAANKAASDEAVATAQAAATAAEASATAAAEIVRDVLDSELSGMVDLAATAYGLMELAGVTSGAYESDVNRTVKIPRIYVVASGAVKRATIVVSNSTSYNPFIAWTTNWARVLYLPKAQTIGTLLGSWPLVNTKQDYMHVPALKNCNAALMDGGSTATIIFSPESKFEFMVSAHYLFMNFKGTVVWADGTTFDSLGSAHEMFEYTAMPTLPDTFTFSSVYKGSYMFRGCALTKLPAAMQLTSLKDGNAMFYACKQLEVEDLVRVLLTVNDLQALSSPTTGSLGLPVTCKHNGEATNTQAYLNANHPDLLTTLAAKGWTVTFA